MAAESDSNDIFRPKNQGLNQSGNNILPHDVFRPAKSNRPDNSEPASETGEVFTPKDREETNGITAQEVEARKDSERVEFCEVVNGHNLVNLRMNNYKDPKGLPPDRIMHYGHRACFFASAINAKNSLSEGDHVNTKGKDIEVYGSEVAKEFGFEFTPNGVALGEGQIKFIRSLGLDVELFSEHDEEGNPIGVRENASRLMENLNNDSRVMVYIPSNRGNGTWKVITDFTAEMTEDDEINVNFHIIDPINGEMITMNPQDVSRIFVPPIGQRMQALIVSS
jgi:hypothetical protein